MAFPPHTFATQSGDVPASQLDDNFSACLPGTAPIGPSLLGNAANGAGSNTNLTAAQAYGALKGAIPWEIVAFVSGLQGAAAQQIMRYQPSTPVNIAATSCYSSAGASATGAVVFTIADNGVTIGNVTYSASGQTGTVNIIGNSHTVPTGHALTVTGPFAPDATLGNINVTLGGTRG